MVAAAPPAGAVLPSLLEFVSSSVLVGHNIRFDLSFINHALASTGRNELENPAIDTLAMARRLIRDEYLNCKLSTLADSLLLDHRPSHRALADVLATGDLLHALLERAGSFGIVDLSELLSLPRLLGHPQAGKLRSTAALPASPGVYWFVDGRHRPIFVERADDLRVAARTHFLVQRDRWTARLLRQAQSVGHRRCPDQRSATRAAAASRPGVGPLVQPNSSHAGCLKARTSRMDTGAPKRNWGPANEGDEEPVRACGGTGQSQGRARTVAICRRLPLLGSDG